MELCSDSEVVFGFRSQLYRIFRSCPMYLGYFTEIKKRAGYRFSSPTLKNSERRLDGALIPRSKKAPIIIFEFQMVRKGDIYLRTTSEYCQLQLEHPKQEVRAVIVFFNKSTDPGAPSWLNTSTDGIFQVKYLEDVVKELPEHHPLRLVLTPFLNPDRQQLKETAADCIKEINQADLTPEQRETLSEVFCSFLIQSFRDLTYKEFLIMLDMVPLRETQVFKDLFAEERKAYEKKDQQRIQVINSLRERVGRGEIDDTEFKRLLFEHFDRGEI